MQPHPGHTELPGQAAEPQPAWRPLRPHDPQTLGRYELLGRLGAGGMGVVYAARPLGGGDLVALKVIRSELTHRPELRERFRREVGAARRVAPFCTASVLDADLDGPVQYIVSEYVAGPTLDRVVRQQGPMAPSGLYALAVGVAGALSAIHAAGIVHRDLKPSNVLLGATGPRVIDFGMARMDDGAMLTTHSGASGTPSYMAPELHQGHEATAAADVFAWGATVAFAGTGRPVFGGGAGAAVAYRIVFGEPDLEGLDPHMRRLVEWALGKDPAQRPPTRELLLRLTSGTTDPQEAVGQVLATRWRPVAEAAARSAAVPAPPPTVDRAVFDSRRRRSAVALVGGILAGVLTLGIAGYGVVALLNSGRDDGSGSSGQAAPGQGAGVTTPKAPPELSDVGLLFQDDFSKKANGWPENTSTESGWSSRYVDGAYEMSSGPGGGSYTEESFINTDGVHVELDVRFMPGNPRGAVKIACPVVVSGQPSKPEDVDKLPPDVGLYMQADGSWEIVNGTGEHDYRFDNPRHRTLASGKWSGMRIGQFNRLGVTCLPGRSGRKAAVIASLNDTGKVTYDGNGLEGIGDLATSWVDTSAPIPDAVPIDDTPRTTIQIDNIELWGTEG